MRKRKQAGDPIADYIARTNRRAYKGIGLPSPDLGIEPSQHPRYLRRDAYVNVFMGCIGLLTTVILTWAVVRQPYLDARLIAPVAFGIATGVNLYMGITKWLRLRKR